MIRDDEFEHVCLDNIENWSYAYVGQRGDEYFFIKRDGQGELDIITVNTLTNDDIRDAMWNDFDDKDERISEVRNGNTEQGFQDWLDDISIYDYKSESDYYGADEEVTEQLYNLGLWGEMHDAYCSDEYLEERYRGKLDKNNAEWLMRAIDNKYGIVNKKLLDDIKDMFNLNKMEFLECEDIR